jgi:hypothetical protein
MLTLEHWRLTLEPWRLTLDPWWLTLRGAMEAHPGVMVNIHALCKKNQVEISKNKKVGDTYPGNGLTIKSFHV